MGAFDDLIPAGTQQAAPQGGGMFDDLIPQQQQQQGPRFENIEEPNWIERQIAKLPDIVSPEEESQLRSFGMGAADPSVGAAQLLANTEIASLLTDGRAAPAVNEGIRRKEAEALAQREAVGREGFDAYRMGGAVASPPFMAAMRVPVAAGTLGRILQGGAIGAGAGAVSPVTDEDFLATKAAQVGGGAALGAVIPGGVNALTGSVRTLKNLIDPMLSKKNVTKAAGRVARDIAGDRADDVVTLLRKAEPGETAAQAAVPAGSTEFSALQRMVQRGQAPSEFRDIRIAEEARIGKMWEDLNKTVFPIGKKELDFANIAGKTLPKLKGEADKLSRMALNKIEDVRRFGAAGQRAERMAQNWFPVEGMPRTPGRYSYADELAKRAEGVVGKSADESRLFGEAAKFKQMQADSLAAHGLRPLSSKSIINSINSKLNVPGQRASKVVEATLNDMKERINKHAIDGVLDAHDLYTIRKEIGNSIKTFAKDNQNWDKNLTAGLERNIQKTIDDAVEDAGGAGWKNYLTKYSEGAQKIVDRASREKEAVKMASEGMTRAREISGADEIPISLPNILSRPVMVMNAILRKAQGYGSERTNAEIARLMQNPRELAEVMKIATPSQRMEIAKALSERAVIIGATSESSRGIGNQ